MFRNAYPSFINKPQTRFFGCNIITHATCLSEPSNPGPTAIFNQSNAPPPAACLTLTSFQPIAVKPARSQFR
ncbi:hypothetical protein DSO57_1027622 [Entomophthora muscae]|uniref:Uncharacterized protein n=1 Tax=Entomophthora muscae TaxID=34485 RepID=A0ACC2TP07_9FUNG|nr:hypothetical protein DSO57_1027622 [Entomophthora muscae]